MNDTSPQLLNLSGMARRLGVKSAWLRAEVEAGNLPSIRVGEGHLFLPDQVERVLIERARKDATQLENDQ